MTISPATASPLSGDLVPRIFDATIALLLVKLERLTQSSVSNGRETGTLSAGVVEVLRDHDLKPGAPLTIPFSRLLDPDEQIAQRFDRWNVLPLDTGTHLLIAANCSASGRCDAQAAERVASPIDPPVAELREAVRIETLAGDLEEKQRLLEDALVRGKTLLRRYTLDAVTVHDAVGRVGAVPILQNAIRSPQTTPDEKIEIGFRVLDPGVFQEERHADRANRLALALLINALIDESDREHQVQWMQFVANILLRPFSPVPGETRPIIQSLVRPIPEDVIDRTRQILAQMASRTEQDAREMAKDLLAVLMLAAEK
jgi:hypothetical protein